LRRIKTRVRSGTPPSTAGNYTAVLSARPRTGNGSLLDSAEGALTPGETRTFSLSAALNASQVGTIVLANQTLTTVAPSDLPESGSGDDSSSATGSDGVSGDGRGDGSSTAGDTGSDDSSSAVDGANTSSVTSQTGSDLPGGNSYWVLLVILLALFIGTLALQEYADGN